VLFDVDLYREDVQKNFPPFVGGDEEYGGFLAAQLAIEYFEKNRIIRPKVLVVRGATTNWESKRSCSFAKSLREAIPDADIFESPKLHYDRTQSRRYLLDHIAFQPKPEAQYHLIFSCNDDMALGCRTALLELNRLGSLTKISTKIIGYDGMREVQELIRFDDQIILGTIDVQLDKQLELLCKILRQEMYLRGSCQSRYLIKPRVVKASSVSLIAVGE
jgi:ABC-type sugar transport system substrate-binding protein